MSTARTRSERDGAAGSTYQRAAALLRRRARRSHHQDAATLLAMSHLLDALHRSPTSWSPVVVAALRRLIEQLEPTPYRGPAATPRDRPRDRPRGPTAGSDH